VFGSHGSRAWSACRTGATSATALGARRPSCTQGAGTLPDPAASVRAMAPPAFEVRPGRLTRSLVLMAVVIGVAAGAMACVAGLASGRGHEHGAVAPVASAHAGHSDVGVAAGVGAGVDVDVGVAGPDDSREASGAADHPGMSCVVEVDLEVADERVAIICDPVDTALVVARTQGSDGPEPPVPRSS
jgi:hypothetical protein